MLKTRLIPVLFIKNGHIVRSESFTEHKIIGNVVNEVRRYNQWNVDELVYIDISRTKHYDSRRSDHNIERVQSFDQILSLVAKECFMPLTFGGGIRSFENIEYLLKNGADKVILNTLLFKDPMIVKQAVKIFGSQAIVASLDFKAENQEIFFYCENGTEFVSNDLTKIFNHITDLGCGEVFINSINNDGLGEGYDILSIKKIANFFNIPVIACGGAGSYYDFEELYSTGCVDAIAAGNIFHFTENSYPSAKNKLKERGYNFR